ncbi:hypothetical protein EMIHUDRAFT_445474 [Emiliania huxleyi CCMP1516]|uniref:Charged multivesicular body protein 5 n=2 Tax=Emiliania huxleyi TaxID=2903 RepID=A0A0D3IY18_EMIH1|nr:hypothetical protein EMIHUDRAFT_445474 [Emiliania huxleyi CCMP1516]EOD16153.1 hypothetical protein EMIHUDRAFT_445474 [Emiliania huxleyi CCMP1516]|eukprot:XP_005768582.1 hypothetical protein EMIHUDRAFT_445474 [Emiliania huxleyi CCMP1516]
MASRLFGKATPKAPAPTTADISQKLGASAEGIDGKIQKLETELARYTSQMKNMKDGPAKKQVQKRAMQILKQKKMYEAQRDRTQQQQFNMDQIGFTKDTLVDTKDTVNAMKAGLKDMKKEFKKMDLGKIEDLQDDMADMMEQAEEIQSTLGRSYAQDDVDDADLEAELAAMEDDPSLFFQAEESGEADYLSLPSTGTGEASATTATKEEALPSAQPA